MSAAVLVLDDELAAHLVEALGEHVVRLRRQGRTVPRSLVDLLDVAANTSDRRGQSRPTRDDLRGRLLTYRQAAAVLGLSERTIRRRVGAGDIRTVPWDGGRPRILADDLPGVAS